MKIKFIGNSHLGTLAPTLAAQNQHHGHDLEYYISRTYGTVRAGVLGDDSGTVLPWITLEDKARFGHVIDLRGVDLVVLVGLRFSLVQMVELWRHFHPVEASGSYASPTLGPAMWEAYVDAAFEATVAVRILESLPDVHGARMVLIPQPAPAAWVAQGSDRRFLLYRRLVASGDWERVRTDFSRQLDRLAARGVTVFHQPESTVTQDGFTRGELAMGDPSDTSQDSFFTRGDFYHMNTTFAQRLVPEFFAWANSIQQKD